MNPVLIYVLDTHALVWFLKRDRPIGKKALTILLNRKSRLVIPIYAFEEIGMKSVRNSSANRPDRIGIPPATALRAVTGSINIKIFPKSPAVLLEEERLRREVRLRKAFLDAQDLPICATALAIQKAFAGTAVVYLLSKDADILKWGRVPTVWR
jgi:predicted nucleic acid-binding protein